MKQGLKLILACVLCIVGIALVYVLVVLGWTSLTEYQPDEEIAVSVDGEADLLAGSIVYSILTWNIGYAGLGSEMDFFYEGGSMVRPTEGQNADYLKGISGFIANNDTIDFILLQEVDFKSKRSYRKNQMEILKTILPGYTASRAINYRSTYVPSPLFEPMGGMNAGLSTFSKFKPLSATRIATPNSYSWPKRLYLLKRCFLVSRYALSNGKTLMIVNIHNSAFDDASDQREKELAKLRTLLLQEYNQGNYIVVGGDWNQNPPGWYPEQSAKYVIQERWPIEVGYLPEGWSWSFDPGLPTNRDVHEPFDPVQTPTTLLDYFLVSPNVRIISVETIDLEFKHSDHQPVLMSFRML
jgi:endonuclease/exonuclease/phosphatase family metal-dependent hydrolase